MNEETVDVDAQTIDGRHYISVLGMGFYIMSTIDKIKEVYADDPETAAMVQYPLQHMMLVLHDLHRRMETAAKIDETDIPDDISELKE